MNVLHIAQQHREQFPEEFLDWLRDNQHIWVGFVSEASKVINAGFKHYSARTIIHVLRHHSALAERDGEWKINNNHSPYLGRLFALVYPQHENLFEFRVTRSNQGFRL